MSFTHKQGRFEGPYHKLLELIEDRKLSINEISLALVADEYIAYIKSLNNVATSNSSGALSIENTESDGVNEESKSDNKDGVSQFIVVASTLMLIKAKSLLPAMEYSSEEKKEVETLEYKLNLYKTLMDAVKPIRKLWHKQNYGRDKMKIDMVVFSPGNVRSITLQSISILTMVKLPHLERLKSVAVAQAIKIENVIEDILLHISSEAMHNAGSKITIAFKDIYNGILNKYRNLKSSIGNINANAGLDEAKTYKIVSFLGVLDLIRNGLVQAEQGENDIIITPINKV